MLRLSRFVALLFAIALCPALAHAQGDVSVALVGFPANGQAFDSPFVLDDLEPRIDDGTYSVQVTVNAATPFRLRFEPDLDGETLPVAETRVLALEPGVYLFTFDELGFTTSRDDYLNDASTLIRQLVTTGRLPNGTFGLTVTVLEAETDFVISDTFAFWEFRSPAPPLLVSPGDADLLDPTQPVILQWDAISNADLPFGATVAYEVILAAVDPALHRTPEEAIVYADPTGVASYDDTEFICATTTCTLTHTKIDPVVGVPIEPGRQYAWQVRARVTLASGQPLEPLEDNGVSEVWQFEITSDEEEELADFGEEDTSEWTYPAFGAVAASFTFTPADLEDDAFTRFVADGTYEGEVFGFTQTATFSGVQLDPQTQAIVSGEVVAEQPTVYRVQVTPAGQVTSAEVSQDSSLPEGEAQVAFLADGVMLTPQGIQFTGAADAAGSWNGIAVNRATVSADFALNPSTQRVATGEATFALGNGAPLLRLTAAGLTEIPQGVLPEEPIIAEVGEEEEMPEVFDEEEEGLPGPGASIFPSGALRLTPDLALNIGTAEEPRTAIVYNPDGTVTYTPLAGAPSVVLVNGEGTEVAVNLAQLTWDPQLQAVRACSFATDALAGDEALLPYNLPIQLLDVSCQVNDGDLFALQLTGAPYGPNQTLLTADAQNRLTLTVDALGNFSAEVQTVAVSGEVAIMPAKARASSAVLRVQGVTLESLWGGPGFGASFRMQAEAQFVLNDGTGDALTLSATVSVTEDGFQLDEWAVDEDADLGTFTLGPAALAIQEVTTLSFGANFGMPSFNLQMTADLAVTDGLALDLGTVTLTDRNLILDELSATFDDDVARLDLPSVTLTPLAARIDRLSVDWFGGATLNAWAPRFDFEVAMKGFEGGSLAEVGLTVQDAAFRNGLVEGTVIPYVVGSPDPALTLAMLDIGITDIAGSLGIADGQQAVNITLDGQLTRNDNPETPCAIDFTASLGTTGGLAGTVPDAGSCSAFRVGPASVELSDASLMFETSPDPIVVFDGQATATLNRAGFQNAAATGALALGIDANGPFLAGDGASITFSDAAWQYPAQAPLFRFDIATATLNADGLTATGTSTLATSDSTQIAVAFDQVGIATDGQVSAGTISLSDSFALRADLDQFDWQIAPFGSAAPADQAHLRLDVAAGAVLTGNALTLDGAATAALRFADFENSVSAAFDQFTLSLPAQGTPSVSGGRVGLIYDDAEVAY
ncbi:MAG: hypothetical protein AAF624_17520 [Bacteroidota bacterium]